jgi:hypothetical protein
MRSIFHRTRLAFLTLAAACSPTASGNGYVRELGFLELYGSPLEVTVPENVRTGEPFTVTVVTRGGGCTTAGDTEVALGGAAADVSPYDLTATGPNVACPDILRAFTHEATLRFDALGTATVRVHGRREPGGETITVTRTVNVRATG